MTLYTYRGPVLAFDKVIANNWEGQTYATSEAKARSNLVYQFKMKTDLTVSTTINNKIRLRNPLTLPIDKQSSIFNYQT